MNNGINCCVSCFSVTRRTIEPILTIQTRYRLQRPHRHHFDPCYWKIVEKKQNKGIKLSIKQHTDVFFRCFCSLIQSVCWHSSKFIDNRFSIKWRHVENVGKFSQRWKNTNSFVLFCFFFWGQCSVTFIFNVQVFCFVWKNLLHSSLWLPRFLSIQLFFDNDSQLQSSQIVQAKS